MKLHLTKSLRAAVLACICVATVSTASGIEYTDPSVTTIDKIESGTHTATGEGVNMSISSIDVKGDTTIESADGATMTASNLNRVATGADSWDWDASAMKYNLTLNGYDMADGTASTKVGVTGGIKINGATLTVNDGAELSTNGLSLQYNKTVNDTDTLASVVVNGGKLSVSALTLDNKHTDATANFVVSVTNGGTFSLASLDVKTNEGQSTGSISMNGGNFEFGSNAIALNVTLAGGDNSIKSDTSSELGSTLKGSVTGTGNLSLSGGQVALHLKKEVNNAGTLTINGTVVVDNNEGDAGSIGSNVTEVIVQDGSVLDIKRTDGSHLASQKVTVNAGGELKLANKATGWDPTAPVISLASNDASKLSKLTLTGSELTLTEKIELKGNTYVSGGTDSYISSFKGYRDGVDASQYDTTFGTLSVSNTNNVVDVVLQAQSNMTLDVAALGELTLNKGLATNGQSGATNTFNKTGDGTLIFGAGATADGVTLNVEDGVLDLSNVMTFDVASLNLAEGTTIILGENTRIEVTDSLTIDSGVIFDVSSWCTYDEFTPYDLFTFTGDASNISLPENVTIHTSTGDNDKAWLEFDAATGNVKLIPEPTTATLSLLALAGLAARRRRK